MNSLKSCRKPTFRGQEKTIVIIAHRLITIRNCDNILVLQSGKLVEIGQHEELIKNENGVYAKMWKYNTAI